MSNPDHKFKRPESVLVVVYTITGSVLLVKRTQPVFWQSVTGSLKWPDETPEHAARRELFEETGIDVKTDQIHNWHHTEEFEIPAAWTKKYGPNGARNVEHQFSLELPDEVLVKLNPKEHSEAQWCPMARAIEDVWSWTNRSLLQRVQDKHNF